MQLPKQSKQEERKRANKALENTDIWKVSREKMCSEHKKVGEGKLKSIRKAEVT